MNHRSSVLNLATAIVVLALSSAVAADKKPTDSQPSPRQVDQKEVEAGRSAAKADISKKLIRYDIVGQPSMIDAELQRIAASRYGISVTFHGCCAGPRIDYDTAYLETVRAHLKNLHGFDPVVKLEKELREKQK